MMERAALIEAVEGVVAGRRSVRGFLDKSVPQATLERVFKAAQAAPSNCNVQPWRTYVASGAARDRIRAGLMAQVSSGTQPSSPFGTGNKFDGVYRVRQVECAAELYGKMGVAREDKPARLAAALRNFELFDAPHVAFVGMLDSFGHGVALDVGTYLQTVMLLMEAHGIASCAQASLRYYPEVVRQEFDMPTDIGILCGISFGYEDPDVAANRARTNRQPLADNVQFRG